MATMISEVYDAFIASGAPEDKARQAAEAIWLPMTVASTRLRAISA
jgi:hypothetical protein